MARHAHYTHEETVENMQNEFNEGMKEIDNLESALRKEMDILDKIIGG